MQKEDVKEDVKKDEKKSENVIKNLEKIIILDYNIELGSDSKLLKK